MDETQSKMILDLWDLMKPHVKKEKRKEFLFELFKRLEYHDIFVADLKDLKGEDAWIDAALADYLDEDEQDNGDEEYNEEW